MRSEQRLLARVPGRGSRRRTAALATLLAPVALLVTFVVSPTASAHDGQPDPYANADVVEGAVMAAVPCTNGFAGEYPCRNVDLLAQMPLNTIGGGTGNDIWGWTDPQTGREYALMGRSSGTAFVDVTNPESPVYLGNLPTATSNSSWRDIKVHNNHAYIVSEASGHGLQVFNLTRLRNVTNPPVTFTADARNTSFGNAHNLDINTQTGFAYVVGSNTCSGGPRMFNLANPTNPTFVGCVSGDGYTHDVQPVVYNGPDTRYQGREILFASNEDTLTIWDVTTKSSPVMLSRTGYSGSAYTHQGWLSEDHRFFFLDDELDEQNFGHNTRTRVFNVSNLTSVPLLGFYSGPTGAIDHNLYVKDGLLYESNYTAGLRIVDGTNAANPSTMTEVAFFDVHPQNNNASFNGTWSNYPFYASGIVVVSSIERGLFVLRPNLGGEPPPPGEVVFEDDFETNQGWTTNPNGTDTATTGLWQRANPEPTSSGGSALQLGDTTSGVNDLVTGATAGASVGANDIDGGVTSIQSPAITLPGSGDISLSAQYYLAHLSNATSADFFRISVVSGGTTTTVFQQLGAASVRPAAWGQATADLSGFAGQTVRILVQAADAATGSLVEAGVDDLVITGEEAPPPPPPGDVVFEDDFETAQGWTANAGGSDTATTGLWQRANPEPTSSGGTALQLGDTTSGVNDLVTGATAGGSVGANDIDGGVTTIRSPAITLPSTGTLTLSMQWYLGHLNNATSADFFRVVVIGNTTSTVFEQLGSATTRAAAWGTATANLSSFAGQTVRIEIQAADAATGSLVEAGVDDVRITRQA